MRFSVIAHSKPKRLRTLLAFAVAVVLSFSSHALKIGDITVNSVVGERFFAVVPLDDISRNDANNILVSLAPRSVYQRLGVDFEYFHTGFIFDVLIDDRNRAYLRVVSKDVVYEPYIDFVVSFRWPGGFQSRQFTALLDMPLTSAAPVPVVRSQAQVTEAVNPSASKPTNTISPSTSVEQSQSAETRKRQIGEVASTRAPQVSTPKDIAPVIVTPVRPAEPVVVEQNVTEQVETSASEFVEPAVTERVSIDEVESVQSEIVEPAQPETEVFATESVAEADALERVEFAAEAEVEASVDETPFAKESSEQEPADAELANVEERSVPTETLLAEPESDVAEAVEAKVSVQDEPVVEERQAVPDYVGNDEATVTTEAVAKSLESNNPIAETDAAEIASTKDIIESSGAEKRLPERLLQKEELKAPRDAEAAVAQDVEKGSDESAPVDSVSWQVNSQRGDTLWALARQIREQSGGRIIDIVNALHKNNSSAFIGDDANLLRVGQRLNVSASQLYAQTPEQYRSSLNHVDTAETSLATSEENVLENSSEQNGVLSLVANDGAEGAEVSDLTASLSQETADVNSEVEGQIQRASEQVDSVENRVDQLIEAYQSLAAKTDQLKAIEKSLDESEANNGLAVASEMPEHLEGTVNEEPIETESSSWLTWLLAVCGLGLVLIAAYWLSTILKARRIQQHKDWVERDWDEELFDEDLVQDEELASVVELRGESALVEQQSKVEYGGVLQEGLIDDAPNEGAAELQASLYLAYERYAEAEKLIKENLERDPSDTTLKSLLLEVYAATEQDEAFEALAAELVEADAASFEQKVSALRN